MHASGNRPSVALGPLAAPPPPLQHAAAFLGALPRRAHRAPAAAPARRPRGRAAAAPAAAAPASPAAAAGPGPRLADLELNPVVSVAGFIQPEVPAGTGATVFAIYDQAKILQYVGFSKDLRASLRAVFGRRPDRAHSFRAAHLPDVDQARMVDLRAIWFEENSGPPPGNRLAAERDAWQAAAVSFSISERGRAAAAEELAKQLVAKIRARGCREEFLPDPALMAEGRVDFLAAEGLSEADAARLKALAAAAAASQRRCETTLDGEPAPFELAFSGSYATNGGAMFDVRVTFADKETSHRVIVGREYSEGAGLAPEDVVERIFAFLLRKRVPRQTEGMLISSQFHSNYFSASEVHQFFDDFEGEFPRGALPGDGGFWRFNRTQDYGYKGANESGAQLSKQFALPPPGESDDE